MSKEFPKHGGEADFDRYRRFIEVVPLLAEYAQRAMELEAHSYRGFVVGAAAEVIHPKTSELTIFAAGNSKPRHKAKFCAEQRVVGRIRKEDKKHEIDYLTGLVVAGTADPVKIAEVTDFETPTLHPCADCRNTFIGHRLVRNHALIVTTGILEETGESIYQAHTIEELRRHYDDGNQEALSENVHTFDNWDERLRMFDHLHLAESTVSKKKQRAPWQLAKMALTAPVAA